MAKDKPDQSVVRNAAYKKSEFSIRERHNERKNESYHNGDIDLSRSHLNVHFCENLKLDEESCTVVAETYEETFNRLIAEGKISTKGQKKDGSAKVFDELVFDVNTDYFDRHGGYDYAKSFFEEAYRMAVQEVGGEDYIISAVMHADERNKTLSEELGRDVYHYHLHVVYVPVVDKEVYFSKSNKDPEKAGKLREVIKQVSHSKKWPRFSDGKGWVNSYSLLQDRYHDHMKQAGFVGFERGERGSTAEHLETLDYKIQQDKARAAALETEVEQKQETVAALDAVVEEKQEAAAALDASISDKEQTAAKLDATTKTKRAKYSEWKQKLATADHEFANIITIERMGEKRNLFKNIQLSPEDWKMVSDLAKEGIKAKQTQQQVHDMYSSENTQLNGEVQRLQRKLERYEGKGITDEMKYYQARQRAPQRMAEVVADIMRQPPEKQAQERTTPQHKRSTDLDR